MRIRTKSMWVLGVVVAASLAISLGGSVASAGVVTPLTVRCGADGATVDGPTEAAADGVHLRFVNETDKVRHVKVRPDGMLVHVEPGETVDEVAELEPGTYRFLCKRGRLGRVPDGVPAPGAVTDPNDYFHPTGVECDDSIMSTIIDWAPGAPGIPGEPEEILADRVRGLEPGDAIDYTGYPEGGWESAGVTRDGRLILEATFMEGAVDGNWLIDGWDQCTDEDVRLRL